MKVRALAQPRAHAGEEGPAVEVIEIGLVEGRRVDADQHVVIADDGLGHIPEFQYVR